eukprot:gene2639-1637_t
MCYFADVVVGTWFRCPGMKVVTLLLRCCDSTVVVQLSIAESCLNVSFDCKLVLLISCDKIFTFAFAVSVGLHVLSILVAYSCVVKLALFYVNLTLYLLELLCGYCLLVDCLVGEVLYYMRILCVAACKLYCLTLGFAVGTYYSFIFWINFMHVGTAEFVFVVIGWILCLFTYVLLAVDFDVNDFTASAMCSQLSYVIYVNTDQVGWFVGFACVICCYRWAVYL